MSDEEKDASEGASNGSNSKVKPEDCSSSTNLCENSELDCQPSVAKMLKTWTFGRHKKGAKVNGKKRKGSWTLKFGGQTHCGPSSDVAESAVGCSACICTRYRRTEEHHLGSGLVFNAAHPAASASSKKETELCSSKETVPFDSKLNETLSGVDFSKLNTELFPVHAWNHHVRQQHGREREEGTADHSSGHHSSSSSNATSQVELWDLTLFFQNGLSLDMMNPFLSRPDQVSRCLFGSPTVCKIAVENINSYLPTAHTRVEYEHCLVPDFLEITNSSFYWGKMDRYEADKLLENKPEGTFLLRDSAQEEYLFSVSFRRYGRTLHARVEQREHRFSFDSHDPNVFSSSTVCGLIEHYKYPSNCMFFEPKLTIRLHRVFPFSLQHLCRAVVCSRIDYNSINKLQLPKILKSYLKEYHYKHKVRAENLDKDA